MGIELGIPFQNQTALSMFMGKTTSIKSYLWLKDCPLPDLIVWVRQPWVTPRRSHGWFDLFMGTFSFYRVSKTWYSCIIWWPYYVQVYVPSWNKSIHGNMMEYGTSWWQNKCRNITLFIARLRHYKSREAEAPLFSFFGAWNWYFNRV